MHSPSAYFLTEEAEWYWSHSGYSCAYVYHDSLHGLPLGWRQQQRQTETACTEIHSNKTIQFLLVSESHFSYDTVSACLLSAAHSSCKTDAAAASTSLHCIPYSCVCCVTKYSGCLSVHHRILQHNQAGDFKREARAEYFSTMAANIFVWWFRVMCNLQKCTAWRVFTIVFYSSDEICQTSTKVPCTWSGFWWSPEHWLRRGWEPPWTKDQNIINQ